MKNKIKKFIEKENKNIFVSLKEEQNNLLLCPKHRVYAREEGNYSRLNLSTNSFVLNTSTRDCSFNLFSPDQIGQSFLRAAAKYNVSFACVDISSTFFCLLSSLNNSDGAKSLVFSENNMSNFFVCMPLPLAIIAENNSLASTINSIYGLENLDLNSSAIPMFILSASSLASFSDNLLLAIRDSNTALCNATDLENCLSNSFKVTNSLINVGQSNSDSSISIFNSSGMLIQTSAILTDNSDIGDYKKLL